MSRLVMVGVLCASATQVSASQLMAWELLQKAATAGKNESVSGTFTHFADDDMETFRLYRVVESGKLTERRISLDGIPRELIRKDNELVAYAPDAKALAAARLGATKLFPAILPGKIADLEQAYTPTVGGADRVAGRDCRWLQLSAKASALRYGLKICVDLKTSLPLKSVTHDARGRVVEQFAFTEVNFGNLKDKKLLRPEYRNSLPLGAAVMVRAEKSGPEVVTGLPSGFRLLRYSERQIPGHEHLAVHYIYSDGLTKLSLFVEPGKADNRPVMEGPAGVGVVSRQLGDHIVTLVGDMPKQGLETTIAGIRISKK